jgi:hypothetical protein
VLSLALAAAMLTAPAARADGQFFIDIRPDRFKNGREGYEAGPHS